MTSHAGLPQLLFPDLVRKITVCKNIFLLSVFVAVMSICTGLVTAVVYFTQFRTYQTEHLQLLEKFELAQNSDFKLANLESSLLLTPKMDLKKETDRSVLMSRMQNVLELRNDLAQLIPIDDQSPTYKNLLTASVLENTPAALLEIKTAKNVLVNFKSTIIRNMRNLIERAEFVQKTLIWAACLSIVFGLIIPVLVLKIAVRLIVSVKDGVTMAAKEFVSHWVNEKAKWGPENHQSAEFYLRFLLMAIEQISFFVGAKSWRVAGEIARWIRLELLKNPSQNL